MTLPAFTYETLLDIDTGNDPTTINIFTEETSAGVRIILRPTTPGETIGFLTFGIGCEYLPRPPGDYVETYGMWFDLPSAARAIRAFI